MPTSIQSIDSSTTAILVNGIESMRLTPGSVNVSSMNGGQLTGMRNKIINGAMMIDQRNSGATITPADGNFPVDRWKARLSQASKYTAGRVSVVGAAGGAINALKVTSLGAYTPTSTDFFHIQQTIEGLNTADLYWGTAAAASATLSFWVNASASGMYAGSILNNPGDRSYVFNYAVNAPNTWEYKTITVPGDTTGTWDVTTNIGIILSFSLASGSTLQKTAGSWGAGTFFGTSGQTNMLATTGASLSITCVQFERGLSTPFEFRNYGVELAMSQRYYCEVSATTTGTSQYVYTALPAPMRAAPTITVKAGNAAGGIWAAAPYGTSSIRQSNAVAGAADAQLSVSAEL